MANRPVDEAALTDLRSSLERDVAGLAGPSFAHRASRARHGERGDPNPAAGARGRLANLNGGVDFLDDERRLRLLAREIKRLIIEDARRGIDV